MLSIVHPPALFFCGLDYTVIKSFSSILKSVDPFVSQKEESYRAVLAQVTSLAHFLLELLRKPHKETRLEFEHLLLVSVPSLPTLLMVCISMFGSSACGGTGLTCP